MKHAERSSERHSISNKSLCSLVILDVEHGKSVEVVIHCLDGRRQAAPNGSLGSPGAYGLRSQGTQF